jgi:hypothetical protein
MNTRNGTSRCDRIIALIDECLADVDSTMRSIAGEGRTNPVHPNVPSRHLAAVRS